MSTRRRLRRQLRGADAVDRALDHGEPLRQIVVNRDASGADTAALVRRATSAGVPVQRVAARVFRRLQQAAGDAEVLGLLGSSPGAGEAEVLRGDGATWQLVGVAYPGNAGMALRTAEVSGAAGAFIDASFDRAGRRAALRASLRADRFLPVFFGDAAPVVEAAARCGRRIIALENIGATAPWEVDLTGRVHFVVGGEAEGIPDALLARCDATVCIPMPGFVASYNLQAALAAVASERLRQVAGVAP